LPGLNGGGAAAAVPLLREILESRKKEKKIRKETNEDDRLCLSKQALCDAKDRINGKLNSIKGCHKHATQ